MLMFSSVNPYLLVIISHISGLQGLCVIVVDGGVVGVGRGVSQYGFFLSGTFQSYPISEHEG